MVRYKGPVLLLPGPCDDVGSWIECLLLIYVIAPSIVISEWVPTCNGAKKHGNSVMLPHWKTMTCYPIQSHYPDTKSTSVCPILIMSIACLGSNMLKFLSHCFTRPGFKSKRAKSPDLPKRETDALLIRPSRFFGQLGYGTAGPISKLGSTLKST